MTVLSKTANVCKITIIGLGLIGGSLGLALKQSMGNNILITGLDEDIETQKLSIERGAVDVASAVSSQGVTEADFVFLCVPMLQMIPVLESVAPGLKAGTILSDVGSVKGYLIENVLKLLPPGVHFVPGHPMTGREKSGISAADKTLFEGKWYIITPYKGLSQEAVDSLIRLIEKTGAKTTSMDVVCHDLCTSVISHVPHVAAAAMVNLLDYSPDVEKNLKLAGGGFHDTTRIASSNADMWADVLMTNPEAITDSLEKLKKILNDVTEAIDRKDRKALYDFFKSAKNRRDELLALAEPATLNT